IEVYVHRFRRAQVEHDALLAAVQVPVQQRDAVDDRERHLADVVAARPLDLDHLGAEVGQMHADRARAEERAFDDADTGEEAGMVVRHGRITSPPSFLRSPEPTGTPSAPIPTAATAPIGVISFTVWPIRSSPLRVAWSTP